MPKAAVKFVPQLATLPVYVPGRPIEEVAREHGLDPSTILKVASNENPLGPSPKAVRVNGVRSVRLTNQRRSPERCDSSGPGRGIPSR
jgi:histidinol-phosphate/aromatic aminotransferase/cobyric acid decarboxylase-like protein